MEKKFRLLLLLALLMTAATGAWAQSTSTEVSTFADLQTALSAGNDVKLTANIQFTSAITISGSKKITINGNGKTLSGPSTRAFTINSGNTLVINNATLDNFDLNAGGGAIRNNGTLVLDGCTVSNNHTDGSGQGGGAIENQGTLYANNTTFSGNYSSEIGGAINNNGGKLYLSDCTFINNYTTSSNAKYGGAIGNNSSNTVVIVNCTFSGNKYGGSNGSASDLGVYRTPNDYTIAGCTGIAIEGATLTTYQYGTVTLDYSDLSAISFTYDQSDTPIATAPPVNITWDAAARTATIAAMPAGNVIVEPEYFAVAEFTDGGAPTGIADIKATTDDDIVKAGTVKNIGSSTTPQGTVMYYAVQSATEPTAPDYDATGWTDKVPTATDFAEGNVYVWYYIKGAEPASGTDRTDANTCSDSEITALGTTGYVTLLAAPKYNAEFAFDEGTPDAEKAKWGTNIPDGGVVKGTAVTVTYTGSKKVLGVKAEKNTAYAANEYNYAEWDYGDKKVFFTKRTAASVTAVTNSGTDVTWGDGWYTVSGNVTINGKVTLSANTSLILQDGATLTINGQLNASDNDLHIYGQMEGTGKLNVTCNDNAIKGPSGMTIKIHGGEITATATGDSHHGLYFGYIEIYSGKLTATAADYHAIGFDSWGFRVYGGEVEGTSNATSGNYNGIQSDGSLMVYGGKVKGTGSAPNGIGFNCKVQSATSNIKFYFHTDGATWGDGAKYEDEAYAYPLRYAKAE